MTARTELSFKRFPRLYKWNRILCLTATALIVAVSVSGCDLVDNQLKTDRSSHLDFQDYRDSLAPRVNEEESESASVTSKDSIPDFQSYVAAPDENMKPMPLVSVSVNQTVPLRDVLYELAEQADYDIELDPRIAGSIIFTARERPFDMVIKRISEIAGLRYKFEEDSLRVELDLPYQKTYKVDYLSYVRKNTSNIKNNVSVNSEGAGTGSDYATQSTSEADFWKELDVGIGQILGVAPSSGSMVTSADPQVTAVDPVAAPVAPVVTQPADGAVGPDGQPLAPSVEVAPPQATLQVTPLPTTDPSGAATPRPVQANTYSVNKQAGIISVIATERQHEELAAYLTAVKRSTTAQVLIEAKVLEVSLTDEYAAGINWSQITLNDINLLGDVTAGFTNAGSLARPFLTGETSAASNFQLGIVSNDATAVIDALSRFGTVHALASPRLTVLNNQSAVLNVATNQVYFEIDIETTATDTATTTTVDSEIRNVPEGVLINVQPSIDLDNRTISMAVRPTVTRITEYKEDPGVAFVVATSPTPIDITSGIPVVNVQEMDSIIKVGSGQAAVLGGLLQDRTQSEEKGIPLLSEVPLIGNAFKNHTDSVVKTELVIFLKATIVDSDGQTITQMDKDLYKRFSGDRRPLGL